MKSSNLPRELRSRRVWSGFCRIVPDVAERLIRHDAAHWGQGCKPVSPTFVFTSEESPMPLRLKVSERAAAAGHVPPRVDFNYKFFVTLDPSRKFTDERTGRDCQSLDRYVIRLYLPDMEPAAENVTELRFETGPDGTDFSFRPAPVWSTALTGKRERGCLWFANPGTEYRVGTEAQEDTVLFNGPVVIATNGAEERGVMGAVQYRLKNGVDVYDRREDRLSMIARAEHIRRRVGKRKFEFVNLRELPLAAAQADPPHKVLTLDGFQAVE